jgi:hypothetical protein
MGLPGLWDLIDSLPPVQCPHAIRGDCNYGSEGVMAECEARNIPYLFKIRQTAKVKTLIDALEQKGGWVDCGQGVEGIEGELRLSGWSRQRRVIVARSRIQTEVSEAEKTALPLLTQCGELPMELVTYQYIVLVTTMPYKAPSLVALYRERGDAENPFDELKNQWGWAGFTTQDLDRCQVTARR